MKRLLAATAVLGLSTLPSLAADIAPRAYNKAPMMADPGFNWSGFYAGVNLGGGWSHTSAAQQQVDSGFGVVVGQDIVPVKGTGLVGGAQVGYNMQLTPLFVAGVEADFSGTGIRGNGTISPLHFVDGTPFLGASATAGSSVEWLASIRGRLGVNWDRTLIYATGGAAWGGVKYEANTLVGTFTWPGSETRTRLGWVVGGGIEHALLANWTVRAEYLHYQLDHAAGDTFTRTDHFTPPTFFSSTPGSLHIDVVRFGVNYKFNEPPLVR